MGCVKKKKKRELPLPLHVITVQSDINNFVNKVMS